MAKSRAQKAALNTMTAAAAEVVALICGLILPRLILANFGSAYNGITSSARQYLNALSILNVGIAGSTRVALYKSLSRGDIAASSAIVRATEKHMRRVGLILAAYVLVLMVVYPLLVDTGYTWIEVAPLILAAGVGSFGTYFFGTTYQAFLSADQCVYISNLFLIAATIANTAISAALILMGCTVQVVMLVSSAVLFMKPFLQSLYVRKKYKLDRHCQPDELALSRRRDVMAHSIANIVHDNTDIVVLTIFCDVKVVSVYTVYNLVMHALKKIQGVFTTGTEAVFGSMWARGETDKIRTTLGYFEYAVGSFITVVFSTTLVMILPFIAHYTHRVTDVEYVLPAYAAVITIAQMCYCLRAPYLTLVQGAGRYRETKKGAYLEAIINLTVSVVLVQFIGIVGVAVGTLLANIIRTMQYVWYIDKHLIHRGMQQVFKRILWIVLNVSVIWFAASGIVGEYAYQGWLQWVIAAAGVALFSCAVLAVSSLLCWRGDMMGLLKVGKGILRRRRRPAAKKTPQPAQTAQPELPDLAELPELQEQTEQTEQASRIDLPRE